MNMKLSKKDKMMLSILGIIIVVAVFFVYVIMPAKDKSKELDTIIETKTKQAQEISQQIAGIHLGEYTAKLDDLYEMFYANYVEEAELHEYITKIELEKKLLAILSDPRFPIANIATTGWSPQEMSYNVEYDEINESIVYYVVTIPITFGFETRDQLMAFIDYFENDPNFVLNNFSISFQGEGGNSANAVALDGGDPNGNVVEKKNITGTCQLKFFMGDKVLSDIILKELPKVNDIVKVEGKENVIEFSEVANAVGYEIYFVDTESGTESYELVRGTQFSTNKETHKVTANISLGNIKTDKSEVDIVVRAIGDKETYFKTVLDDNCQRVTIKKA